MRKYTTGRAVVHVRCLDTGREMVFSLEDVSVEVTDNTPIGFYGTSFVKTQSVCVTGRSQIPQLPQAPAPDLDPESDPQPTIVTTRED